MHNKRMKEKVADGDAIDISSRPRLGPYYVLDGPPAEGIDYCDAQTERWIWSIGQALDDLKFEHNGTTALIPKGTVVASIQPDLYGAENFDCLWLR